MSEEREDDTTEKPIGANKWKLRAGSPVTCVRPTSASPAHIPMQALRIMTSVSRASQSKAPDMEGKGWKSVIVKPERRWETLVQCKVADERQGQQVPPCGETSHCAPAR